MKPIVKNLQDGYFIRAYRHDTRSTGSAQALKYFGRAFEFIIVEFQHPNYGYYADGMFWWRGMHSTEWKPECVHRFFEKYDEPEKIKDFITDFPEFKGLFGELTREGSVLMRGLKRIMADGKEEENGEAYTPRV